MCGLTPATRSLETCHVYYPVIKPPAPVLKRKSVRESDSDHDLWSTTNLIICPCFSSLSFFCLVQKSCLCLTLNLALAGILHRSQKKLENLPTLSQLYMIQGPCSLSFSCLTSSQMRLEKMNLSSTRLTASPCRECTFAYKKVQLWCDNTLISPGAKIPVRYSK